MSYYNCDATLLPQIYLVAIIQISGLNFAPLTKFRPESRFRLSECIYIRETERAQLTFTDFNFATKCCYPEKNVTELPIGPLKFLNNVHNNAIHFSKMANSKVSTTVPTGLSPRQVQGAGSTSTRLWYINRHNALHPLFATDCEASCWSQVKTIFLSTGK